MASPIGILKVPIPSGGYKELELYDPSEIGHPVWRVQTPSGVAAVLLGTETSGNIDELKLQGQDGKYAAHEASTDSITFNYTGSVQSWQAPDTLVPPVTITLNGAGGGGGASDDGYSGQNGANGGQIIATLDIQPGETLYIYVPRGGRGGRESGSGGGGGWGAHNGGSGGYDNNGGGGGGGGSAEVRIGADTDSNAVASAGGGRGGRGEDGGGRGGGGQHASEGGGSSGTGLVIDHNVVTSSTITQGGGASRGNGRSRNNGQDGSDGSVILEYTS